MFGAEKLLRTSIRPCQAWFSASYPVTCVESKRRRRGKSRQLAARALEIQLGNNIVIAERRVAATVRVCNQVLWLEVAFKGDDELNADLRDVMRLRKARERLTGVDTCRRNLFGQMPLSHVTTEVVEFPHLLFLGTPESQTQECVFHHHIEDQLRRTHRRSQSRIMQKLGYLEGMRYPLDQSDGRVHLGSSRAQRRTHVTLSNQHHRVRAVLAIDVPPSERRWLLSAASSN
eukprot:2656808-Pleurochrysis_carterae.AAC.1